MECKTTLLSLDLSKVHDVPLKGTPTFARVVRVIDGDTIRVIILIGDYPLCVDVRVLGVDCPESLKRNAKSQLEMDAGLAVKRHIIDMIEGKIVTVTLHKKDKYCRFLGDITLECGTSFSKYLSDRGYAKVYLGKTKEEWTISELNLIVTSLR